MDDETLEAQVLALDERRAWIRADGRVIRVAGSDALGWLNDLLTAGIHRLGPGESVRSLLLTPTGRIRADVHVLRRTEDVLLLQATDQPDPIDELLGRYVLSSGVDLVPADDAPVLVPDGRGWRVAQEPPEGAEEVETRAAETWRIRAGVPRFPVDLDGSSLPAEAGLDVPPVTDDAKGCFLGQESVAKVRTLGHPPRIIVPLRAEAVVLADAELLAGDEPVGVVTSVARIGQGVSLLARVGWDARDADLRTRGGVALGRA